MDLVFPTSNPILIVAIAFAMFLVAPPLLERLRLPGIVGLILAGALLGPNGLEILRRDATIELLGAVGIVYLMFMAGLELDLVGFQRHRSRSFLFGAFSFSLPFALAIPAMTLLGYPWQAAVLVGAVVASHTLLAFPIASRLGITKDPAVTSVMGGTLLTDALSLGALAVIDAAATGAEGAAFWLRLGLTLAAYLVAAAWVLPRLGRWFFRNAEPESTNRFLFLMAVLFVTAFLAELAGAQPIIGAFLAGLLLNRLIPEQSPLMSRVRFFGNAFFIPFFLLSVGMLFDARALVEGPEVLVLAAVLIGLVLVGKGGAALVAGRVLGYSRQQGWLMAGLSTPQAAATLAVTFVGLEIGLFDDDVVSGVIVLILVSCVVGATLVERVGRRIARATEQEPYRADLAPHRILVPLANPDTAEALMDVAMMLRGPDATESLFPMTVVAEDDAAAERVAAAEAMLAHAVVHAADADVPTNPLTRVAQNPAAGIARAVSETRITDIVIGWAGRTTAIPQVIFGNVIDQTLTLTEPQILVCRLRRPVATHARIVAVLPPLIDYNPGFYPGARTLTVLASRLGLPVTALAVAEASSRDDAARLERRVSQIDPDAEVAVERVGGWPALRQRLRDLDTERDLVFVLSARKGTLAHAPDLERLPTELTQLDADFVVAYPSETPPPDLPRHNVRGLPRHLSADRVHFDIQADDPQEAVRQLLAECVQDETLRAAVATALFGRGASRSAEVLPGVLVYHTRLEEAREPLLLFGIDRDGIPLGPSDQPVHGVTILVDPQDAPLQRHLAALAEITEQIAHGRGTEALVACRTIDDLERWFGAPTRRSD